MSADGRRPTTRTVFHVEHPSGAPARRARPRPRGAGARPAPPRAPRACSPGAPRRPVRREGQRSGSGPDARDPVRFGDMISRLVAERGWQDTTAAAGVLANWEPLVGPEIADHCRPASLQDGELVLVAESSAWATQLRLLTRTMTARLAERVGPRRRARASSCADRRRPTGARARAASGAAGRATPTADRAAGRDACRRRAGRSWGAAGRAVGPHAAGGRDAPGAG